MVGAKGSFPNRLEPLKCRKQVPNPFDYMGHFVLSLHSHLAFVELVNAFESLKKSKFDRQ